MEDVPRKLPPYLNRERTRHGTMAWYVRRNHGPRIRLRAQYDTPEFWEEYRAALDGKRPEPRKAKAQTLRWAIERYRASSAWAALSPATRKQRENIYRAVIATAGDEPL